METSDYSKYAININNVVIDKITISNKVSLKCFQLIYWLER